LVELEGSAGAAEFWQNGPRAANVGVTGPVTVTSIVAGTAHCPAPGVKVYVTVPVPDVFIAEGFHIPVIPLLELEGNTGETAF
jgi:hypothetical protein